MVLPLMTSFLSTSFKSNDPMTGQKLLVANRGEIAIRIFRSVANLGMSSIAVYPADDSASLHVEKADAAIVLPGRGVAAYLDGAAILRVAREAGATAIHPGYGFLSENAAFARACAAAGIAFVGPTPEILDLFGDKHRARQLAQQVGVPTLPGTEAPTTPEKARAFMEGLGAGAAVMVKAVAGGGGRGMRPVLTVGELEEAFARCRSEATAAFGSGDLYVEQLVRQARHIEVQVIGDGAGVAHLWERDCSLQRQRQKLVEFAPAPNLDAHVRQQLLDAALMLARAANYRSLGTFEFLVDSTNGAFYFIEANPRLQVEHTVTEAVTGLDLVELQLRLADGATLAELGLARSAGPAPRGMAMQLRINVETMQPDGTAKPGGGLLSTFEPPSGPDIRVDGYGYAGYATNPAYDSLLAKLIVFARSGSVDDVTGKGYRALCEFNVAGAPTNIAFLQALLSDKHVRAGNFDTGFVAANAPGLLAVDAAAHPRLYATVKDDGRRGARAGAKVDATDPLSVLTYGQSTRGQPVPGAGPAAGGSLQDGMIGVRTPMQGTVISVAVSIGDAVPLGVEVAVMEAMKMEHVIKATASGIVRAIHVEPGETLWEDQLLLSLEPSEIAVEAVGAGEEVDLDAIRPDLAEMLERRALTRDENRPEAVKRRHTTNHRTARENVEDLIDPGTFVEYGPLVVAAQRHRRTLDDLLTRSPADGLVTGVGRVNGHMFDAPATGVAVMAYDYTVFAGTQGVHNHWKTDKILDIAEDGRMPLVLFAEGGGGRPGDDDYGGFIQFDTFHHFGQLSALVPLIGIVSGRCFAGNASLLGCCDVIIATADTTLGMGGPAMVEGGGLGVFTPEEIGPMAVQTRNGVVDILVADEAEAVAVAKRYLAYFQGPLKSWTVPDQRLMRHIVPENRLRTYEVRDVIQTLADEGSVLELRRDFGRTLVTALIRLEGRTVGVMANDPKHLSGAVDSDGSDKGARFMQLCDAYDIPMVNLCDTPGIMVGPEAEKTALVRHAARMFLTSCNMSVPYFTIVLRKAYGLGQSAMAGGNYRAPYFYVSWPTGEFAPMGIEGQVKLGFRAELAAIVDPEERLKLFEAKVAQAYEAGKALNRSTNFMLDDVIDPAETRSWVVNMLAAIRPGRPRSGKKRPMIDSW
jgi:acetyl/propionyl-CoA carboxylase alpha subunit/acetyl-CoA carboxylase carboxyltransferase component